MLSVTSSNALTYNELSSDFSKSVLLLLLTALLAISVLSSFLRIGLRRGTGLAFGGTTFDTVISTGFSIIMLLSTGLG